jgi:hypothetical protein
MASSRLTTSGHGRIGIDHHPDGGLLEGLRMTSFASWLMDVLASRGIDAAQEPSLSSASGFSFESEAGVAIVSACHEDSQVRVDLPVAQLNPAAPDWGATLLAVHEFNGRARWLHNWILTLDEDDVLILSQVCPLDSLRPQALDTLIDAGFGLAATIEGALGPRLTVETGATA